MCIRLKTIYNLKKLSADGKKKWKCDECFLENSSSATNKSEQDGEDRSIVELINKLREELIKKLDRNYERLKWRKI